MILPPHSVFLTKDERVTSIPSSHLINLTEKKRAASVQAESNEWIRKKFNEHLERNDEPIRFLAEHVRNLQEGSHIIVIVSKDRLQEERCKELLKPYFLEGFDSVTIRWVFFRNLSPHYTH
jgi:hypothetical protein